MDHTLQLVLIIKIRSVKGKTTKLTKGTKTKLSIVPNKFVYPK